MKKFFKWGSIVFVGLIVLMVAFGGEEEVAPDVETEEAAAEVSESQENKAEEATKEDPVEESEPKEEAAKKEEPKEEKQPEMSLAQQNAIGAAEQYISVMPFSKEGLIKQLTFDQYSEADAKFAVDNIEVDWNEQAVKSGKQYLDTMSFSRSGLIDQLVFDGYTQEQATHAVDQIGL